MKRGAVLNQFPELRQSLSDVAGAQQAVDTAAGQAKQAKLDFQQGAARHFLNAEPEKAVGSALNGKNPVGDMRALARMVAADPDAKAGLQRAVADHLSQRLISNPDAEGVGKMSASEVNDYLRRNMAIAEVFSPEQMKALNAIAADLGRNAAIAGAKPAAKAGQATVGSLLRKMVGPVAGAALGYVTGENALLGFLAGGGHAGEAINKILNVITHPGAAKRNALLTEALLNPDLAKTLLMKASEGNRPFIAGRLQTQLRQLLVAPSAQPATAPPASRQAPVTQSRRRAVAAPMLLPPARLVPGGALQQR